MEIIFNQLSYVINQKNSKEIKYLDNVNLVINGGNIVGLWGENLEIIGSLLTVIKRPSKGEIKLDDLLIKKSTHINNVNGLRKRIGVFLSKSYFNEKTVKDEIKSVMKNFEYKTRNVTKHIVDSLKLVGMSEDYLNRNINELSFTEKKKVELASILSYNPEVIVLNHFYKGLIFRDREYFKKLFLKLKNRLHKTIIVIESELDYFFGLADKVYIFDKGKLIVSGGKEIFYNDKIYPYAKMPKIVEFTKYVQSTGHKILEYTDIKELIKEIYRNV